MDPTARAGARYRALFEHSRDGIYLSTADGRLLDANPALLELLGKNRDALIGRSASALYADPEHGQRLHRTVVAEGLAAGEGLRIRSSDGRERICSVTLVAERDGGGAVAAYHGLVHDVTESAQAEERLRQAALHDDVTQLPNRAAFLDRTGRLMERVQFGSGYRFAVLVFALDRFKLINDSLGRQAGDDLLLLVSQRLTLRVRPEDIVARLGGDQFAVLVIDLHHPGAADTICARIQEGLLRPFAVPGSEVYLRASMGIALSHAGYRSAEEMVRDAETAMYVAKQQGLGGWAVFEPAMHDRSVTRLDTETALRRALERGEFVLHYQPLVSMKSGRVVGFEALVRWMHPERGLLAPAEFLSVAEDSGLIVPLGEWVLREACRTAASWRAEGSDDGEAAVMAVNLSARQLMVPGFAQQVREILGEHRLPGSSLRLEITESVFLESSELLLETMQALAGLGVTLCLDDFGTGYSTLSYLRDLPVHSLKIDRSFVKRVSSAGGSGMVETILSIARQLGLGTVAEGVETDAQMADLLRLGCDDAQGFLFSAAVDGERARQLMGEGPPPWSRPAAHS